ncbi:Peptidoglycan hydrolase FlgJ [Burkholderiales bacterium]|nr:Peptidoglycan hydrolase FlgJ [Burkholderiales bacterium]
MTSAYRVETQPGAAFDAQALARLKLQAAQDPQKALKAAAQQFEAVFVDMLLKSMRATLPKSGVLDSQQTQFYTSMLDSQMAQSMASRGMGLADLMVKQLQQQRLAPVAPGADRLPATPAAKPAAAATSPAPAADAALPKTLTKVRESVAKVIDGFTEKLLPHALAASQVAHVPAFFLLGQAALETGWGRKEIVGPQGEATHNLFGVKAGKGWTGKVVEASTTEWIGGEEKKVVEKFRAYDSYADAFADYARLLTESPRYAKALAQAKDAVGFAQGLQQAGYATDPQYGRKLTRTIESLLGRYGGLA